MGGIDVNEVEEARIDAGIALIVKRFPAGDRPALLAFLMRRVYAVRWTWVAARLGMDEGRVRRLAGRGRRLLEDAVGRGRLDRAELAGALAASAASPPGGG